MSGGSGPRLIHGCAICAKSFYREANARYCMPCARQADGIRARAHRLIKAAVKRGELPHIKTQYCVDCGSFAQAYDHRNYSQPLVVEPVCRKCNFRRGPGIYAAVRDTAAPEEQSSRVQSA